jgi:hypothetical protein
MAPGQTGVLQGNPVQIRDWSAPGKGAKRSCLLLHSSDFLQSQNGRDYKLFNELTRHLWSCTA